MRRGRGAHLLSEDDNDFENGVSVYSSRGRGGSAIASRGAGGFSRGHSTSRGGGNFARDAAAFEDDNNGYDSPSRGGGYSGSGSRGRGRGYATIDRDIAAPPRGGGRPPRGGILRIADMPAPPPERSPPSPPAEPESHRSADKQKKIPPPPGYRDFKKGVYKPKDNSHYLGAVFYGQEVEKEKEAVVEKENKPPSRAASFSTLKYTSDSEEDWIAPKDKKKHSTKPRIIDISERSPISSAPNTSFDSYSLRPNVSSDCIPNRGGFSSNIGASRGRRRGYGLSSPVSSFSDKDNARQKPPTFRVHPKPAYEAPDSSNSSSPPPPRMPEIRMRMNGYTKPASSHLSNILNKQPDPPVEEQSPEDILDEVFGLDDEEPTVETPNVTSSADSWSKINPESDARVSHSEISLCYQNTPDKSTGVSEATTPIPPSNPKKVHESEKSFETVRKAAVDKSLNIISDTTSARSTSRTRRVVYRRGSVARVVPPPESEHSTHENATNQTKATADSSMNEIFKHLSRIAAVDSTVEIPSFDLESSNPFELAPRKVMEHQITALIKCQNSINAAMDAVVDCQTALDNKMEALQTWHSQFSTIITNMKKMHDDLP